MDHFSKYAFSFLIKNKKSQVVANCLNILLAGNKPDKILCDNGKEFMGPCKEILDSHGIKIIHGSPYHPQTQGAVESFNKYIHLCLLKKILPTNPKKESLETILSKIVYDYNNIKTHSTTKVTPSYAYNLYSNEHVDEIQKIIELRNKKIPFKKPNLEIGDLVLISMNFKKEKKKLKYLKYAKRKGIIHFKIIPDVIKNISKKNTLMVALSRTFKKLKVDKDEEYEVDIRLLKKIKINTYDRFVEAEESELIRFNLEEEEED